MKLIEKPVYSLTVMVAHANDGTYYWQGMYIAFGKLREIIRNYVSHSGTLPVAMFPTIIRVNRRIDTHD